MELARYKSESTKKQDGETFTPSDLANFVSSKLLFCHNTSINQSISILEPAIGDGALLLALLRSLNFDLKNVEVVAYDTNYTSLKEAKKNILNEFPNLKINFFNEDFLEQYNDISDISFFSEDTSRNKKFDLIIANPPYVRTQILGAKKASEMAKKFKLRGRVDLYQAFLVTMISLLKDGGTLGAIVSNRFLTTKSGNSIRDYLKQHVQLDEIWDLGDTKLFDAAVLPALIFASKKSEAEHTTKFTSVYECPDITIDKKFEVFNALLNNSINSFMSNAGKCYEITRGTLKLNESAINNPWMISNNKNTAWLETVAKNTKCTFGDVSKVRVGVKTTADKIFMKKDWSKLKDDIPELLYPLITRRNVSKFTCSKQDNKNTLRKILYPYDIKSSTRKPIELSEYPKTRDYLLSHKEALSSRKYVIDAGRQWYEIWVPHSPSSWKQRKVVFPDISEKPMFGLDDTGSIVSGECYWLVLNKGENLDLYYLILGIANSKFIEKFYDISFPNKLYSGKRRFITQYVQKFPMPCIENKNSQEVIELTKKLCNFIDSEQRIKFENQLDVLVEKSFGL